MSTALRITSGLIMLGTVFKFEVFIEVRNKYVIYENIS